MNRYSDDALMYVEMVHCILEQFALYLCKLAPKQKIGKSHE